MACFYITSLLFVLVVLGAVARYNGFSIIKMIRYIKDELLLVLGTSSQSTCATYIDAKTRTRRLWKIGGRAGGTHVGYSFNLDGTNIYMTMAALFIAQACNIDLTLTQEITLLLVAMLSSKGKRDYRRRIYYVSSHLLCSAFCTHWRYGTHFGMIALCQNAALTNLTGNAQSTIVVFAKTMIKRVLMLRSMVTHCPLPIVTQAL